ncbi:hypothetical protein [Mobilicoccus sp.]|nr:hypothetical protein [Mobilicoccus sp.]
MMAAQETSQMTTNGRSASGPGRGRVKKTIGSIHEANGAAAASIPCSI